MDITVRYNVKFAGFEIATILDTLQFGNDGTYSIHSICEAAGILDWFGIEPLIRTSRGSVDELSGHLLLEQFSFQHSDRKASTIVQRREKYLESNIKGTTVRLSFAEAANNFVIHDSLTMIYDFYAHGLPSDIVSSHLFVDGRRHRTYVWKRANGLERIEYGSKMLEAVRYDRIKNGHIRSSVWYIPELHMLPGKAVVNTGLNVTLEVMLEKYN